MHIFDIDFETRSLLKALYRAPRRAKGWPAYVVKFLLEHGMAELVPDTDRLQITAAGRPYGQRITRKGNG